MISDRYFKILGAQLKWAFLLSGTPFKWCPKERRLYVSPKGYKRYAGHVAYLALYAVFLTIQLLRCKLSGQTKDFSFYFTYALNVCAIFDIIAAYPVLRRPELAAAFLTEFYRFLDDIHEFMSTFDPNRSCSNAIFDLGVFWMGVSCPFLGVVISFHFIFFPDWPCYVTSLLPPECLTWKLVLTLAAGYFYGLQFIWAALLTNMVCFATYGWYNYQLSNEYYCFPERGPPGMKAKKVWKNQKADRAFRKFDVFPLRYRQFQVLHLNFQEVFSSMIVPMQTTVLNLGIFCNFSLIRYKEIMTGTNTAILLIWTVGATFSCMVALTFAGTMYNRSVKALGTVKKMDWGSKQNNLFMQKFVVSCTPISYGYGRMYVIRMLTTFRFIKHLTRGTFRILLTSKK